MLYESKPKLNEILALSNQKHRLAELLLRFINNLTLEFTQNVIGHQTAYKYETFCNRIATLFGKLIKRVSFSKIVKTSLKIYLSLQN